MSDENSTTPVTPAIEPLTLKFVFEKETKNTIRYAEVATNAIEPLVIGTLYVRKDVAGDRQELTVTIS